MLGGTVSARLWGERAKPRLLGQDRFGQAAGRLSRWGRGTLEGRGPPPRDPGTRHRTGLGTAAPPSCQGFYAKTCLLRTVAGEGWCPTRELTPRGNRRVGPERRGLRSNAGQAAPTAILFVQRRGQSEPRGWGKA